MEKFKETLKKTMPDEISAFIILGIVTVTIVTTIGVYALSKYNKSLAVNGPNLGDAELLSNSEVGSIENLTSVENVNNIEDLQKINEKEIKEAEKKEEEKDKKSNSTTPPYYIKVNYKAQVVNVYGKDSKGKYTKPVRAMVCSTGIDTPTGGVYKIPAKIRWCHMVGDVWGQYSTQIVGNILFHSVPYLRKGDHSSLEYWAYDKLGTKASLGCVRLTCKDAKWIYENCRIGTQVEFYASSNPGPLGKPSARKISNAPSYIRGWDPTDPVSNNPWKKYLKEQEDKNNKNTESKNNIKDNSNKNEIEDKNSIVNKPIINDTVNDIETNEVNEVIVNNIIETNEVVNATR